MLPTFVGGTPTVTHMLKLNKKKAELKAPPSLPEIFQYFIMLPIVTPSPDCKYSNIQTTNIKTYTGVQY